MVVTRGRGEVVAWAAIVPLPFIVDVRLPLREPARVFSDKKFAEKYPSRNRGTGDGATIAAALIFVVRDKLRPTNEGAFET